MHFKIIYIFVQKGHSLKRIYYCIRSHADILISTYSLSSSTSSSSKPPIRLCRLASFYIHIAFLCVFRTFHLSSDTVGHDWACINSFVSGSLTDSSDNSRNVEYLVFPERSAGVSDSLIYYRPIITRIVDIYLAFSCLVLFASSKPAARSFGIIMTIGARSL